MFEAFVNEEQLHMSGSMLWSENVYLRAAKQKYTSYVCAHCVLFHKAFNYQLLTTATGSCAALLKSIIESDVFWTKNRKTHDFCVHAQSTLTLRRLWHMLGYCTSLTRMLQTWYQWWRQGDTQTATGAYNTCQHVHTKQSLLSRVHNNKSIPIPA